MKHKLSFLVALWWVILCAVGGLVILIVSDKNERLSESENRMLAGFPRLNGESVASGAFMTGFEDYLSDGFPGRDGVISFTEGLMDRFSTLSRDEKRASQAADMENRLETEGQNQAAPAETQAPDEVSPAAVPAPPALDAAAPETDEPEEVDIPAPSGDFPLTEENSYLWLKRVDGDNKILYTYDNGKVATYADTLRLIRNTLPEDGQIFVTQVPLASIGNRWTDQQDTYCGWGSSVEAALIRALNGAERIHIFNTWEILEPHMTEGTPLFYHTDHHWSAEGAYIVAAEMLKSQGLPVIPYEEYAYEAIRSKRNEEGYTDTFNVLHALLPVHSYVITQLNDVQEISLMNYKSTTYTAFMNNTRQPWRRIVTGADTGRKALVICDSFGNAFTPYILPYYDEVHMTDFRYGYFDKAQAGGNIGSMVERYGIDDIYLIFCTANGLRKDNSIVYLREYYFD